MPARANCACCFSCRTGAEFQRAAIAGRGLLEPAEHRVAAGEHRSGPPPVSGPFARHDPRALRRRRNSAAVRGLGRDRRRTLRSSARAAGPRCRVRSSGCTDVAAMRLGPHRPVAGSSVETGVGAAGGRLLQRRRSIALLLARFATHCISCSHAQQKLAACPRGRRPVFNRKCNAQHAAANVSPDSAASSPTARRSPGHRGSRSTAQEWPNGRETHIIQRRITTAVEGDADGQTVIRSGRRVGDRNRAPIRCRRRWSSRHSCPCRRH